MNQTTNILFIAIVTFLLGSFNPVLAQTAEVSPTPTNAPIKNLDNLKERLATKVAELRNVTPKALSGAVLSLSVNSAMIETAVKNYKIEYEDEVKVAQILNGKRTDLSIDDLEKSDKVTVFGAFDESLDLLKAKYIFIESKKLITRLTGVITDIDREEFTITLQTSDGKPMTVDIEKTTKSTAWNSTDGIAKIGFSKMSIGDSLHVLGTLDPKKDTNISAIRILDLGNITGVATTPTPTIAPTPIATVSATVKTTPKPTPKPTLKATPKPTATP